MVSHKYKKIIILEKGDIIGAYSALKNHKNNVSVEVISDRLEVYRIFKGDIISLFGGVNGKIVEALRAIDSTQQIGFSIKLKYLERSLEFNLDNNIKMFNYIESGLIQQTKPRHIDENKIINVLSEALKNVDTNKNTAKLNDLKASLIPNKAKGLSALKNIENSSTLSNAKNGIGGILGKGPNPNALNKLTGTKFALTSNQIASKNKLDAILGIKKPTQNPDEVNAAFQRINDRKKGANIVGNKLLNGLEYSSESVSIDSLTNKLDKENEMISKEEITNKVDGKEDDKKTDEKAIKEITTKIEDMKLETLDKKKIHANKYQTEDISKSEINFDDEKLLKTLVKKKSSKIIK